jgi:glycosyltransferase involved in cell wall biosynthesis
VPQWTKFGVNQFFFDYMKFIESNCDLIFFPSKSTKIDAEKKFVDCGLDISHIQKSIIRFGDRPDDVGCYSIDYSIGDLDSGNYVLYVSTIEARKNHRILYHIYHILCSEGYGDILPNLVFVGRIGWGVDDLLREISLDPVLSGKIKIIDKINDSELIWLYKNAMFCVYPSYYEGWGLPVAEALSHGKVVVVSDNSSLPEVGGDCAIYLNAFDTIAWRNMILRLVQDSVYRKALEDNIRMNYQSKKWAETCEVILEVIFDKNHG